MISPVKLRTCAFNGPHHSRTRTGVWFFLYESPNKRLNCFHDLLWANLTQQTRSARGCYFSHGLVKLFQEKQIFIGVAHRQTNGIGNLEYTARPNNNPLGQKLLK